MNINKLNKNKMVFLLSILIIFDVVTTMICIMLGGFEYNPISLFFISQSFILFVLIKIIMVIGLQILNRYTLTFEYKINKISMFIAILIFTYIVLLNSLFIVLKLIGVI